MSDKKSFFEKFPFLEKLKKIKGIEYIIVGVICVLVFVIYFSAIANDKNSNKQSDNNSNISLYAQELENKLSKVLSQVYGAGEVNVMVTLESSSELIIATSTEERVNTSSGTSNSTQSTTKVEKPIIINDSPLVVMEILPKIKGIIVVAQGANNVKVRLELLKAVQTLIDVDANNIEILVGQ